MITRKSLIIQNFHFTLSHFFGNISNHYNSGDIMRSKNRTFIPLWLALTLTVVTLIGAPRANTLSMCSTQFLAAVQTTSTTFVTATNCNFNMPYAGAALAMTTFSMTSSDALTKTGQWRLNLGANTNSVPIHRYLSGTDDQGIAGLVHIFTNLNAGANTLNIQHQTSQGTLFTLGLNAVLIPLVTSDGIPLNYGLSINTPATNISADTFNDIGVLTSVTLDHPGNSNDVFLAASINSMTTNTAADATGEFKLQYQRRGDMGWTDSGASALRFMKRKGTDVDIGAVLLVSQVTGLNKGTNDFRLVSRYLPTTTGQFIITNATLVAVSLSYVSQARSGRFPSFSITNGFGSATTSFSDIPGTRTNTTLASAGNIFAMMSFSAKKNAPGAVAGLGSYRISVTNSSFAVTNVFNSRWFSDNSDWGSGGSLGLFYCPSAGDYAITAQHLRGNKETITTNVNLVGFSTTSTFTTNQYTFQVVSPYGAPSPAVGIYTNYHGVSLTNYAGNPTTFGGTQYVCTGWTMTGNAPLSGSSTNFVMTLTNNATLTWSWRALQGTLFSFR
jgi:hypothetical protein